MSRSRVAFRSSRWSLALAGAVWCWGAAAGVGVSPRTARGAGDPDRLPVKEVTIFKDGHAFVLHAGEAAVDAEGLVRLRNLPTPVIGTLWPFSSDPRTPLTAAAAGRQRVPVERTAVTVRELLTANLGATVSLRDSKDRTIAGKLLAIPHRSAEELERLDPSGARPRLPEPGTLLLLETESGLQTVPLDTIVEATLPQDAARKIVSEELQEVLTLRLDWGHQPAPARARVGMTYLQKGLRWIPNYRVTLQKDGRAEVELQATVLNELADLDGVAAHLVVGVPTFQFQETLDPLALDRTLAELSAYFRKPSADGSVASQFSNAIMLQTQVSRMSEHRAQREVPEAAGAMGAEVGADEDLFLFTLPNLTLRRGERLVTTLGKWTVAWEDLYRLRLPPVPPVELHQYFHSTRQAELAELQQQPKVQHVARLKNSATAPFTTAPVLLMQESRVLAQGMMTYTSVGSTVDLEITAAVNIPSSVEDNETGRVPDAMRLNNSSYQRINLDGRIRLTNFQNVPVRVEVERMLLGAADVAGQDGEITRPQGPGPVAGFHGVWGSGWWSLYSWPWWWRQLNPTSRLRWQLEIPAGGDVELTYSWHYFWG